MLYDYYRIEQKWQQRWDEANAFEAKQDFTLPKYFSLVEFPYPSGQGLHVGHPRPYTAMDVIARKKRMDGYNVLFPIGYDAFGLPTENFAIKNKVNVFRNRTIRDIIKCNIIDRISQLIIKCRF